MSKYIDIIFILLSICIGIFLCSRLPSVEDWRTTYNDTFYGDVRVPITPQKKVYIVWFARKMQDGWLIDSLLTGVDYGFADTESISFNECIRALEVDYVPYSVDRYELASKIKTCLDIADVRVDE